MPLGDRGRRLALRLALGPVPAVGTPAARAFADYMLLVQQHYRPRRPSPLRDRDEPGP